MNTKFKYYHVTITKCSKENKNFLRLYGIFRSTINPGMGFREFYHYYFSAKLEYIDVTFCYCNGVLAGFCSAAFYSTVINGKKAALGRAATGILQQYQQIGMPKLGLFYKYAKYKYRHPFTRLIVSAFVANAIIYAMICKYTAWVWPRVNCKIPGYVNNIKSEIVSGSKTAVAAKHPYLVKINFTVSIGNNLLQRIYDSKSRHVQYFLRLNPGFYERHCLIVIIPFTWMNLLFSTLLFLFYSCKKKIEVSAKHIAYKCVEIFSFTANGLQKINDRIL